MRPSDPGGGGGFSVDPGVLRAGAADVDDVAAAVRRIPAEDAFSAVRSACPGGETAAAAAQAVSDWQDALSRVVRDLHAAAEALDDCAATYATTDDNQLGRFTALLS